jgi:PadR family transcriptional regulator, regulatory protein PadR
MGTTSSQPDFLPGTLEMLVLKILCHGPDHGYGIAQQIQIVSRNALKIGEGSLYPALQRLLLNGWVKAEWGVSENSRRARYYTLTAAGQKQLTVEVKTFSGLIAGINRILEMA